MSFVLNISVVLKIWCDALSCAPLGYDCGRILFCSSRTWTRNKTCPDLEEMMWWLFLCSFKLWLWANSLCNGYKQTCNLSYGSFSCVPLSCDCEWISFCNGCTWTCSLSYGPSSCVPLGCDCGRISFAIVTSEFIVRLIVHFPVFL